MVDGGWRMADGDDKTMSSRRRSFFLLFALVFSILLSPFAFRLGSATAADYPSRPIRMVIPFPPGGSIDIVARSISQRWSAQLGQPIVIDNRGGAGGSLGTQTVAHATPNGYTLLYGNAGPLAIAPHLFPNIGYDLFKDFAPVSQVTSSPFVVFVTTTLPVGTVQELVAYAKQRPGKLSYASSGVGSGLHLMGELFKSVAGVDLLHVPFKGMGQASPELASGRIPVAVSTVPGLLPHVKSGRMKGVVSSGARRSALLPDVPTCTEAALPGFCSSSFHAIVAPARTPRPVIDRVQKTLAQTLSIPELREQLAMREDSEAIGGTPEALAKLMRSEYDRWGKIIRTHGIKGE
jgi:tripartite-type tricarboxylate transporter receptor subunit TctC